MPRQRVSDEDRKILKQFAQDNQIIEGFLFNIKDYVYSKGEPIV